MLENEDIKTKKAQWALALRGRWSTLSYQGKQNLCECYQNGMGKSSLSDWEHNSVSYKVSMFTLRVVIKGTREVLNLIIERSL